MRKLFKSFRCAFAGIREALSERNFKIQTAVGAAALLAAAYIPLQFTHLLLVILCCAIVLGAEAANSAVERLSDFVSPSHHDDIKKIKDLMAAAVLLLCGGSFIVGILIFSRALF